MKIPKKSNASEKSTPAAEGFGGDTTGSFFGIAGVTAAGLPGVAGGGAGCEGVLKPARVALVRFPECLVEVKDDYKN